MKFALAAAAAVLALAACQPSAPPADPAKPADAAPPSATTEQAAGITNGCAATAEVLWGPIGPSDHPSYRIQAWTQGADCQASVTTLAIFARDGYPIYAWSSATQYIFGLKDVTDATAMNAALVEWMSDSKDASTTATLPAWEATEGQPRRAEFPFMPAEGYDKAAYEQLKKDNLFTFCFPQGIESLNCLALHPGDGDAPAMIEEIGLQLFPG